MSIPPENYRYILEGARVSGPISKKDLEQASQFFQSLYDNGGPFYDKQLLRRVSRQLSDAVTSKTTSLIRVDGLDGEPVNFELQIGRVSPSALHRGFDSVAVFASLSYESPQRMYITCSTDHMKAYCSIRVTAHMAVLNDRVEPLPSLELVRAMWNRHRQAWEASESCRHLREILRGIAMTGKVSRLVGFALGDITAEDLEGRAPVRSAMQHAFLLTLQDILRERQHVSQLPCYAQDIAYNETDKTILAESGCTVLDDPQGFVEVDDESVVVSLYPNCPVKEIIHDLAKPAVIIWDAERDDRGTKPESLCDPFGPRVEKWLLENYDKSTLFVASDVEYFGPCQISVFVRRERPGS